MRRTRKATGWVRAAVTAVGLTVAAAAVAMAGRAPLSSSMRVDAVSARAPATALFVLFAGAGIVALAGLAMLSWSGRRRKQDDEPEFVAEPLRVHWIWKVLAVLLPFALGAALVAAVVLGVKTVRPAPRLGESGTLLGPHGPVAGRRGGSTAFVLPSWLPWTALAIVGVALAAGTLLLVMRRERPAGELEETSAARAGVDAAISALETATDPRGAVIAAYAAMERTFAGHGVARMPSEAAREYLDRVLVKTSGAERDARRLTTLFEEARFSLRPISEQARTIALAALSSLRAHFGAEGAR